MASIKVQYVKNISEITQREKVLYYEISSGRYFREKETTPLELNTRTVYSYIDLPVFTDAVDCVYYVMEKKNSYIMNAEKDDWLLVTLNKYEVEEPVSNVTNVGITANPFLDIIVNESEIVETSLEEIAMTQETKRAITFKGSFMTILKIVADEEGMYKSIELGGMRKVDEYFSIVIHSDGTYQTIEEGSFQRINEKIQEITDDSTEVQYPSALAVQKYVLENGGGGGGTGDNSSFIEMTNLLEGLTITRAIGADNYIPVLFKELILDPIEGKYVQSDKKGNLKVYYKYSEDKFWQIAGEYDGIFIEQGKVYNVSINRFLKNKETVDIKISVTGGEQGKTKELTYSITGTQAVISLVGESTGFHLKLYKGDFNIRYYCIGENLDKRVVAQFDGDEKPFYDYQYGTSTNVTKEISVPLAGRNYGVHHLTLYFITPDGIISNKIERDVLYDNRTSAVRKPPMISLTTDSETVYNGEPINVNYFIVSVDENKVEGQKPTTDLLSITLQYKKPDGSLETVTTSTLENIEPLQENGKPHVWTYINPDMQNGTYVVYFVPSNIGDTTFEGRSVEIQMVPYVSEFDDLKINETSLVYRFDASLGSNADANRGVYDYNYKDVRGNKRVLTSTLKGFNFETDGYQDQSLKFVGQGEFTINVPILSSSFLDKNGETVYLENSDRDRLVNSGRTMEFDFKVSQVVDPYEAIISCFSETTGAGFKITPSMCYLLSQGKEILVDEYGFIENEASVSTSYLKFDKRVRVTFVIETLNTIEFDDKYNNRFSYQSINIYINGKFAQSIFYNPDENFENGMPITVKAKSSILNLYGVCLYNRALTYDEVMHNYCVSPIAIKDKEERLRLNNFLYEVERQVPINDPDKSSRFEKEINYKEARLRFNCLLLKCEELSTIKKDWKQCGIVLTKPDDQSEIGYTTLINCVSKNDKGVYVSRQAVQGTSSQTYPTKNCYIQLKEWNPNTKQAEEVLYSLQGYEENDQGEKVPLGIEESQFCWKADFMSTDHANTFNANFANTLYDDVLDGQNPEKGGDPRARTTVYGFRCILFQEKTNSKGETEIILVGDGALNIDKETPKTFGLVAEGDSGNDTLRQRWEWGENGDPIGGFKTDKLFERIDGVLKPIHAGVLEPNYPDVDDPNYFYMQTMYTWVCQRANFLEEGISTTERNKRKKIFKDEFSAHFNLDRFLIYYIFMEYIALMDNREKNMFFRCENVKRENLVFLNGATCLEDCIADDGTVDAKKIDWVNSTFAIWMPDLYDLDSCYGANNYGQLIIPYHASWQYIRNNKPAFNGHDSRLWLMIEEAFQDEIAEKARDLSKNKNFTYAKFVESQIDANVPYNCPALVNADMMTKYVYTTRYGGVITDDLGETGHVHITNYKFLQRGDRESQKLDFMYKRFLIYDSKYCTQSFTGDDINFRTDIAFQTPSGQTPGQSGAYIELKGSSYMYFATRSDEKQGASSLVTNEVDSKGNRVTERRIIPPGEQVKMEIDLGGGEQTLYILGGSNITSIKNVAKLHPRLIKLDKGAKLRELVLGAQYEYGTTTPYVNTNVGAINTAFCPLLETIDIEGYQDVTEFRLTGNKLIKDINISRTNISYLEIPNGGFIENLKIGKPGTISIKNHSRMTNFSYDSLENLRYITVENTPNINGLAMIKERGLKNIQGIQLIGINNKLTNYNDFKDLLDPSLARGKRLIADAITDGTDNYPIIGGQVSFDKLYWSEFNNIKNTYDYTGAEDSRLKVNSPIYGKVVFKDYNGGQLKDSSNNNINYQVDVQIGNVNKSVYSTINNSVSYNKETLGTPYRPVSGLNAYSFIGWSRKKNSTSKEDLINFTKEELNSNDIIEVYAVYSQYGVKTVTKTVSNKTWSSIGMTESNYLSMDFTYGDITKNGLQDYILVDYKIKAKVYIRKSDGALGNGFTHQLRYGNYYEAEKWVEPTYDDAGNQTGGGYYSYSASDITNLKNIGSSIDTGETNNITIFVNKDVPSGFSDNYTTRTGSFSPNSSKELRLYQHSNDFNTSSSSVKYKVGFGSKSNNSFGQSTYTRIEVSDIQIEWIFYHKDIL